MTTLNVTLTWVFLLQTSMFVWSPLHTMWLRRVNTSPLLAPQWRRVSQRRRSSQPWTYWSPSSRSLSALATSMHPLTLGLKVRYEDEILFILLHSLCSWQWHLQRDTVTYQKVSPARNTSVEFVFAFFQCFVCFHTIFLCAGVFFSFTWPPTVHFPVLLLLPNTHRGKTCHFRIFHARVRIPHLHLYFPSSYQSLNLWRSVFLLWMF